MPLVKLDASQITDWESFDDVFAELFGFPDFYGRNLNAWIDCMTYLDDPGAGMTTVHGTASDPVVLKIDNIDSLPRDIYSAIVECSASVNWRRIEMGQPAIMCLAFYRSAPYRSVTTFLA
jgi:hypothetical protein